VKQSRRYIPGDRVELMTSRAPERSTTVVMADVLDAVVQMDRAWSGVTISCWSWELVPLLAAIDYGPPAWSPRSCPPAPRGRLRKARGGRRR
jgi:hypothetical protein